MSDSFDLKQLIALKNSGVIVSCSLVQVTSTSCCLACLDKDCKRYWLSSTRQDTKLFKTFSSAFLAVRNLGFDSVCVLLCHDYTRAELDAQSEIEWEKHIKG
jgi:hypothetical protein